MARITVEDCLSHVDNRFELVLLAAKRARQLSRGMDAKIKTEKDKPTVVALREIAQGLVIKEHFDENAMQDDPGNEDTPDSFVSDTVVETNQ